MKWFFPIVLLSLTTTVVLSRGHGHGDHLKLQRVKTSVDDSIDEDSSWCGLLKKDACRFEKMNKEECSVYRQEFKELKISAVQFIFDVSVR